MSQQATRGSKHWLQIAVNERPLVLREAIGRAITLPESATIEWGSPLASDGFREYRDAAFLERMGLGDLVPSLAAFWPTGGPHWDALGLTSDGRYVLVEAKAHIAEAASRASDASSEPLGKIRSSLEEARRFYAPKASADWTGTFYQYANRLAHHYFLRQLSQRPGHLVFLYFLNAEDMQGPTTAAEWNGAIHLLHAVLGLPREIGGKGVHDVFVDVRSLS